MAEHNIRHLPFSIGNSQRNNNGADFHVMRIGQCIESNFLSLLCRAEGLLFDRAVRRF